MLKLRELRCEKGLSQNQLAEMINVQNYTVGNWERNRAEPSIEMIVKLADCFGCTTDELLGRENYATGIVEICGEQLSSVEKELLSVFRKMDAQNQRRAVEVLKALSR